MISAFSTFCPLNAQLPKYDLCASQMGCVNSSHFQIWDGELPCSRGSDWLDVKLNCAGTASMVGGKSALSIKDVPWLFVVNDCLEEFLRKS